MKRILCYGDSNTWGHIPADGNRYPADVRWTGIAAAALGSEYLIIEDGLNGRTTTFDDYYVDFRNGKNGLGYSLSADAPLDLIVISLGTNDMKYTGAVGSSKGLDELLRIITNANAFCPMTGDSVFPQGVKILVISPIHIHSRIAELRPESSIADKYAESVNFARYFRPVAEKYHAWFLDASQYAQPSVKDCVHMEEESHKSLGIAIANKIKEIFE